MSFMDKFKGLIEPDEEEYEEEDEVVEVQEQSAPAQKPVRNTVAYEANAAAPAFDPNTKMVLFEPRSYNNEVKPIAKELMSGRATVINLHKVDTATSRRIIDFLSGVVVALDGEVKKIGDKVILCYPKEIGVAGSINFGTDEEEAAEEDAE